MFICFTNSVDLVSSWWYNDIKLKRGGIYETREQVNS